MELNHQVCYRILLARDARYDGRFVVCVETTGIYCRPICPVRPPKPGNCSFLPSAAAAQAAGFRACLRCRPESSPQTPSFRGTSATVSRALALIDGGALDDGDVDTLAERLGLGARQLRRLFRHHLGATPVAVAQTRRLLLAKQLIHETQLPMAEVALASGFSSLRRFNETFRELYGRPPSALRKCVGGTPRPRRRPPSVDPPAESPAGADLRLLLRYRPPYDWASMLGFLAARALPGLELVAGGRYQRLIACGEAAGWMEVEHAEAERALSVRLRLPELRTLSDIIARVRHLFDLGSDPGEIAAVLGSDPFLAPLLAARPGLRVPGAFDAYEIAVRAILGQQVTVAAGRNLVAKFLHRFGQCSAEPALVGGGKNATDASGLTHTFPRPAPLLEGEVCALGMPRARAVAICALSEAVLREPDLLKPHADLERAVRRLCELPGIGPWTAQYIAMRAMRESDAFVEGDAVIRRMLAGARSPEGAGRPSSHSASHWRPWRAYAVMHLWAAANDGDSTRVLSMTKKAAAEQREVTYALVP